MKKLFLSIIISLYLAINTASGSAYTYRESTPIVYFTEFDPVYMRERPMRTQFKYLS